MSDFWTDIRADFPITKNCIYLDHASAGPIPRPVQEKISRYYIEHMNECDMAWPKWLERREAVRKSIADFIHADPAEITFINSTSQGMNYIAELLAPEGKVLINSCEFPSSTIPWIWKKADLVWQEPKENKIGLQEMKSLLPGVKTIVTSFVQYSTGFRQDLDGVGAMKGERYFVVNATQGFGAFPVNVQKSRIDFLCSNSYKWLLGGYGSGVLYIKKEWLEKFRPLSAGWRSVRLADKMDNRASELRGDAGRYELGSPNFPAIFAAGAAVEYLSAIGTGKIAKRILELTDFAIQGLLKKGFEVVTPLEPESRSGIVVFKIKDPETVRRKLFEHRIYTSVRGAGIRIAPHFYNSYEEIEMFLDKLI